MTPQEEAERLVEEFSKIVGDIHLAKQCAIKCVEERISESRTIDRDYYLLKVKQEIEKL